MRAARAQRVRLPWRSKFSLPRPLALAQQHQRRAGAAQVARRGMEGQHLGELHGSHIATQLFSRAGVLRPGATSVR
jgi:hypothetical protein